MDIGSEEDLQPLKPAYTTKPLHTERSATTLMGAEIATELEPCAQSEEANAHTQSKEANTHTQLKKVDVCAQNAHAQLETHTQALSTKPGTK